MASSVFTTALVNLILISGVSGQSQSGSFNNVTAQYNSLSANFTCTGPTTDQVSFSAMINGKSTKLYNSGTGFLPGTDQTKYGVVANPYGPGTYNFTVWNPQVAQATTYTCDWTSLNEMYANLVLIVNPTVSVNPVNVKVPGSNNVNGYNVGDQVNFLCSADYGAPSTDPNYVNPLSPAQTPTLQLLKNGVDVTSLATMNTTASVNLQGASTVSASYLYNLQQSDVGGSFNCVVSTRTPFYTNYTSTPINIISAVKNVSFSVANFSTQDVGDNVTCTANGYPLPSVTWIPIPPTVASAATVMSGLGNANLTFLQPGIQTWNCTAVLTPSTILISGSNVPSSTFATIQITVTTINGTMPSSQNASIALGVGLGIGLGLPILIIIIVLLVIFCRKRKFNYSPANKKDPKKSNSPKQPLTGDANRPKRPEPQPPNNAPKVNPNPNPYSAPVLPEQTSLNVPRTQAGRDSPGYGDIGARQMSGTGTPVNESFDSSANRSFDQDRRRGGEVPSKKNNTGRTQNGRPNTDV